MFIKTTQDLYINVAQVRYFQLFENIGWDYAVDAYCGETLYRIAYFKTREEAIEFLEKHISVLNKN